MLQDLKTFFPKVMLRLFFLLLKKEDLLFGESFVRLDAKSCVVTWSAVPAGVIERSALV